ncbi:single-stranded DNA-binding protein [uncultured Clostridium sp.]|uniref:single-stranded DNA-binding protein n=1 Tax=uncultured Clostridium sp. TaxID=59620 RepID=UPI0025E9928D|nr:single-stranded DNA-binding protein [uncultured Clostridium sp.]
MNNVILTGRLVNNPDLNYTPSKGLAVCKFRLAVPRPFNKKETDFINCVAFDKTAETISQYLIKGKRLSLIGHIQTGSYSSKDGSKKYTTDVIVDSFEFIDYINNNETPRSNNSNNEDNQFNDYYTPENDPALPF